MHIHRSRWGSKEQEKESGTYLSYLMVLMLKPSVGLMTLVSSPLTLSTMVVFPELSSPLRQIRRPPHQPQRRENTRKTQKSTALALDPNQTKNIEDRKRMKSSGNRWRGEGNLHHEDAHLLLLALDLPDDAE
jgi:hypothetical protein